MRRISKIVLAFGIVALISILFDMKVSSAATEEKFLAPPPEEALSEDLNGILEINPVNILANDYFLNGKSFISATGDRITVSGNTRAYSAVSTITLNLYLQRWDATRQIWITVVALGPFTKNNASLVNGSQRVTVASGYYYRTRAHHRVSHNGKVEQAYSNTSSIYIE